MAQRRVKRKSDPCNSHLDTCCVVPEKPREGCGWRNPKGLGISIGAVDGLSEFGEFPWVVAILRVERLIKDNPDSDPVNVYVGGGSLILPSVVLTTAHAVASPGKYRARAGEWDTQTVKELFPFQQTGVNTTEIHEDYNKSDSCSKKGVAGVCTNIRVCPDAQEDVKNKQIPQLCDFTGADPIVCCISLKVVDDRSQTEKCVLPPYPSNGFYFSNVPDGKPGNAYDIFTINVTCIHGYDVDRPRSIFCLNGLWQQQMPKCVPLCRLTSHSSIEYICHVSEGGVNSTQPCREHEPQGTVVRPQCRYPNYFSPTALEPMHCINGTWSYEAKCVPVCGTVTPAEESLTTAGKLDKRSELPWHANIYMKESNSYNQLCGGSLISTSAVITGAHCFWVDGSMVEAKHFAIAVGKLYKNWDHPGDAELSQQAGVAKIHVPVLFQGFRTGLQDDIALAITNVAFKLTPYIRPVCLDFDPVLERRQLQPGNKGKAARWNVTENNSTEVGPTELNLLEITNIDEETCIKEFPAYFRVRVNIDKFCATLKNTGAILCAGDNGAGISYLSSDTGIPRYYLRGVFSSALGDPKDECIIDAKLIYTRLQSHEHFIRQFWTEGSQV